MAFSAAMALAPKDGEAMAAIFPPGADMPRMMTASVQAGAEEILGPGPLENSLLVRSAREDFAGRLRRAGALIVLHAPANGECL